MIFIRIFLLFLLHICTIKTPILSAFLGDNGIRLCIFKMYKSVKNTNKPQNIFRSFLTNFQNNQSTNDNESEIKTQTQTKNGNSTKTVYSGIDQRYNDIDIDMEKQIEKENEELFLFFINTKRLELLKILQNKKISQLDKIKAIQQYEKSGFDDYNNKKSLEKSKSKYVPDILAGIYMYDF